MSEYVDVTFVPDKPFVTARDVYQYDYGLIQRIHNLAERTEIAQVQFAYPQLDCTYFATPTWAGNTQSVTIPDEVQAQPKEVCAYVMFAGRTAQEVRIPVNPRAKK